MGITQSKMKAVFVVLGIFALLALSADAVPFRKHGRPVHKIKNDLNRLNRDLEAVRHQPTHKAKKAETKSFDSPISRFDNDDLDDVDRALEEDAPRHRTKHAT